MTAPTAAIATAQSAGNVRSVVHAVQSAAARTGADFDYLLQTAVRESSLQPSAKARTSSAAGLFQFIEQTWLSTVKTHGPAFGLDSQAAAIETAANGRHKVPDREMREAILALRHDPEVSALMAGALTNDSERVLERGIGRSATAGELYVAHFLGPSGAVELIEARESDPDVRAAILFPAAAEANRSIFYDASGRARTVADVYDRLTRETAVPETALAALDEAPRRQAVAAADRPVVTMPAARAPDSRFVSAPASGPGPITFDLAGGAMPSSRPSLVLTPAVVEVLASLDPLPEMTGAPPRGKREDERSDGDGVVVPADVVHEQLVALRGTLA